MEGNKEVLCKTEEIWKPVKGYEEFYEVSNTGKVRNVERYIKNGKGYRILRSKELSQREDKDGYLMVSLCANRTKCDKRVHRLVLTAFVPNSNNLPQVNHKDENKKNNHVDNLEWCTAKYNLAYKGGVQKRLDTFLRNKANNHRYKVAQYAKSGELVKVWRTANFAAKETGFSRTTILDCLSGTQKTAHGFIWGKIDVED